MLPALVFKLEFAPQQAARIVRHTLQPLLDCLPMLVLRAAVIARAEAHRRRLALVRLGVWLAIAIQ